LFKLRKKAKKICGKQFNFSEYFLESLTLFLKKTFLIFILFQCLNKTPSVRFKNKKLQLLKNACLNFRRFNKMDFFFETINILIITLKKKNSSRLLAEFLASQIKILKKQNFFLIVLKQILYTLLGSNIFSTKGIKVSIKGRFNGAPRARLRTILIGKISAQTFKANINYNSSTAYTRHGTFGVKVWIQEIK